LKYRSNVLNEERTNLRMAVYNLGLLYW